MPPRVRTAFTRLERRLQHHFAGDLLIWWPATSGLTTYTVPVTCRKTEARGDARDMAGMLAMDSGTITLHALQSDFPFEPGENMLFMLGPSDGATTPAYTTAARKYQITSVSAPEMFGHYTIQARRH